MRYDRLSAMTLNFAMRPGAALLLGVLCLALGVVIYYELGAAEDESATVPMPMVAGSTAPPLPPQPASTTLPPIESYSEVTHRPLFSPTRQPPPPETVKETQGNPNNFALLGIVISDGGRTALVEYGRPPALARLKEGQAVDGWTLQSILPDRVVLQHGATEHEVRLKDRAGQPAQPRQPGAVPPPPRPGRG
jgi:general secretion pathway protein N